MKARRPRGWRGKRNPLGKPTREFAAVHKPIPIVDMDGSTVGMQQGIYILDLGPPEGEKEGSAKIEADLVGGVILNRRERPDLHSSRPPGAFVTEMAAAVPGYGPLVYEAAASLVGEDIYPSSSRSSHAQRLWGRFPGVIAPLESWEFEEKYGVSLPDMVNQGKYLGITPEDWHEMKEWVDEVAWQAFDAFEEGLDPMEYKPLPYSKSGKYQRAIARRNRRKWR